MRAEIDALSDALVKSGAVEGDLQATIEENKGVYVTRTYRVHEDPEWALKVPEEVRNRAKSFLRRESPGLTEAELDGRIEALLYNRDTSPFAVTRGKTGSKDLSTTKRRKNIAPEIRALLGENTDPRSGYVRSMARMGQLVASHEFLGRVREAGEGAFLFDRPLSDERGTFSVQIAAEGSQTMAPLNGLYTTPEIAAAFEEMGARSDPGDVLRFYYKALAATKAAKTVYSLKSQVRNVLGNILFSVAQGHWRVGKAGDAVAKSALELARRGSEAHRDEWLKLVRLGVVDESIMAGDIEGTFKDAAWALQEGADAYADRTLARMAKGVTGTATRLYQAGDNVWRLYAYYNEAARYRAALPEATDADVERRAADTVRNTFPTYSLVPELVKKARRFPLAGTFVSFPAEVARVVYHSVRITRDEMADPALRGIGLQRLAGLTLAATIPVAATTALRSVMGFDKEDDEAARRFMAPWEKHSQIGYLSHAPGEVRFVDVGYTDPYGYVREPLLRLYRSQFGASDEEIGESVAGMTWMLLEPFADEEILTSKIIDLRRNTDRDGRPIYNPQAPPSVIAQAWAGHIWGALEPGTLTDLRRIYKGFRGETNVYGQVNDPEQDVLALATGSRIREMDVRQAFGYRAGDRLRDSRDAERYFRETGTRRGSVADEEIRAAYEAMEQSRRATYDDLFADMRAARRLGLTEAEVRGALEGAGFAKSRVAAVLAYEYVPYRSPEMLESRIESEAARGQETAELERRKALMDALAGGEGSEPFADQ
jgi:hypothetical protein